jgi:hypothetical protein
MVAARFGKPHIKNLGGLDMQIRNSIDLDIKLIHPKWFFIKCDACKLEYKDIGMWKYQEDRCAYEGMYTITKHICSICAKTREDALKIVIDPEDYKNYMEREDYLHQLSSLIIK